MQILLVCFVLRLPRFRLKKTVEPRDKLLRFMLENFHEVRVGGAEGNFPLTNFPHDRLVEYGWIR